MKPIEELRTNKDVAEWCRDFLRITDELSPELAIADRAERNYLMALVGLRLPGELRQVHSCPRGCREVPTLRPPRLLRSRTR